MEHNSYEPGMSVTRLESCCTGLRIKTRQSKSCTPWLHRLYQKLTYSFTADGSCDFIYGHTKTIPFLSRLLQKV